VGSQSKKTTWLYLNGELDSEAEAGGDVRMDFGDQGMSIASSQGNANFFNGVIDEFKIWNVAFTADDVTTSMEKALAVKAGGKLTTTWGKLKSNSSRP
jgi:hypothetical protein